MKSIIDGGEKVCFVCGKPYNIEIHHIYFGTGNRKISDLNGFTVSLCKNHHTGQYSPHFNRGVDLMLKGICQKIYERSHTRAEFMKLIGRNYLEGGNYESKY